MAREHSIIRRSKSHSSKRKICKFPNCGRERKSTTRHGQTTSKYCEWHSNPANYDSVGMYMAGRAPSNTSSEAFSNHHLAYVTPINTRCCERQSSMPCYNSTCQFQGCNSPIHARSKAFCLQHAQSIYENILSSCWHPSTAHSCAPPSPPLSPLSPLQIPIEGIRRDGGYPPTSTSSSTDGRRTSIESTTTVGTAPASVTTTVAASSAAPAEPKIEAKLETVSHVVDQEKHQVNNENDGLPTFFSGVGVGLCILLQIIHVLLRLLLELARGMGKRGMW
ncbi:uncharacterized protein TRIVIDRAFT_228377 [Trichoderma virens Gv29-8]|uniref:Uncharacterized protein n=1 Tax=Hypocrea virens (strain Gv29-8 / FGSC 10586) TaxID=413071 RepID=G9NCB6_HYPVG|nr:uncharacterized protein TRIVIDRAFT_228377 [Trichoderma virens Gv29-8]EHK15340.1 hypothetical protein TRIVIDRAFT_228377 [Trichoderma virens Gv29-8]UKZ51286.1 hypothetical protein TrVGV298_005044 [Trichoderma virens]